MQKYWRNLAWLAIVFGLLLAVPSASAATVKKTAPKYQSITTGNPQVFKDAKFFLSINLYNVKTIKKTEIRIDGKAVKTCGAVSTCKVYAGPFTDEEIGSHVYSFLITGRNGATSEPWGKFEVLDSEKGDYGDWVDRIRVFTSSYQPEIGRKYNILVSLTDKKQVYYMDLAIDDEELMDMSVFDNGQNLGARTYSSGRLLPAFKKADVGEHRFSFTIYAPNGDLIESGGSFWVVDKGEILPPPVL